MDSPFTAQLSQSACWDVSPFPQSSKLQFWCMFTKSAFFTYKAGLGGEWGGEEAKLKT